MRIFLFLLFLFLPAVSFAGDLAASCPYGYQNVSHLQADKSSNLYPTAQQYCDYKFGDGWVCGNEACPAGQNFNDGCFYYYDRVSENDCGNVSEDDAGDTGCYPGESCDEGPKKECTAPDGSSFFLAEGKQCSDYCTGDDDFTQDLTEAAHICNGSAGEEGPLTDADDDDPTDSCPDGQLWNDVTEQCESDDLGDGGDDPSDPGNPTDPEDGDDAGGDLSCEEGEVLNGDYCEVPPGDIGDDICPDGYLYDEINDVCYRDADPSDGGDDPSDDDGTPDGSEGDNPETSSVSDSGTHTRLDTVNDKLTQLNNTSSDTNSLLSDSNSLATQQNQNINDQTTILGDKLDSVKQAIEDKETGGGGGGGDDGTTAEELGPKIDLTNDKLTELLEYWNDMAQEVSDGQEEQERSDLQSEMQTPYDEFSSDFDELSDAEFEGDTQNIEAEYMALVPQPTSCTPLSFDYNGNSYVLDCAKFVEFKQLFGWVLYILTALYIYRLAFRPVVN